MSESELNLDALRAGRSYSKPSSIPDSILGHPGFKPGAAVSASLEVDKLNKTALFGDGCSEIGENNRLKAYSEGNQPEFAVHPHDPAPVPAIGYGY